MIERNLVGYSRMSIVTPDPAIKEFGSEEACIDRVRERPEVSALSGSNYFLPHVLNSDRSYISYSLMSGEILYLGFAL
jgi:hypothetical protein